MIVLSSWGMGAMLTPLVGHKSGVRFFSKPIIKNEHWNTYLGVNLFQQLVTKTIYGKLNQTIKITNGSYKDLSIAKNEMIKSELGHFIGFISSQLVFLVIYLFNSDGLYFLSGTLFNIILNVYPVLLQQKNKIRISSILKNYSDK